MRIVDRAPLASLALQRGSASQPTQPFRLADAAMAPRAAAALPASMGVLPSRIGADSGRRQAGIRSGRRVLDSLDQLRLAALGGGSLSAALDALAADAEAMEGGEDAGLDDLLDAIRLRAEVEIEKHRRAR